MAKGIGPRPAGWKGGSEDFTIVRQGSAGHIAFNGYLDSDPMTAEDRRNGQYPGDFCVGEID